MGYSRIIASKQEASGTRAHIGIHAGAVLRVESFSAFALDSWMMGANMQCKLFVALQLKALYHVVERLAGGTVRGVEDPGAFGATPTGKTFLLNPNQLPTHGGPLSLRPIAG
jgi:hypothetical protein